MKTAVLGTGTMGAAMARRLVGSGSDVAAWNRAPERAAPLRTEGIAVSDSVADAVAGADVVLTPLFDVNAVLSIVRPLVDALEDDAVWLQCATVGPQGMAAIGDAAGDVPMLDAPVLGSRQPAEEGALTFLISGDDALVDTARPVLDALGSKTVRVGSRIGGASALKLACNTWLAAVTAGIAQSMSLASGLGVDGSLVLDAISGAPTDCAYARAKGSAMNAAEFSPSFTVDALVKDLELALGDGSSAGVPTGLLGPLLRLFDEASTSGHGLDDVAAVVTRFQSGPARS